jgi:hypothetical protein
MPRASLPVLAALVFGFCVFSTPAPVDVAESEYTAFHSMHDLLHPPELEKREPHRIFIRKTFWDNDKRILRVDAVSSEGRGALMVVEGLPGDDWLSAFSITDVDGATFELPVPAEEAVPCRVVIRAGSAVSISDVANAPALCDQPGEGIVVLASL